MMRKDVNLLVFIWGCDDEAQAGLQGAGKAKAQGRQASLRADHCVSHSAHASDQATAANHLGWCAIHRSRKVKTWLQDQDGSLAVARLPAYAPELNPVEAIWAYLKKHEIANLCCDTIGEVGQFARNRLRSMQRRSHLIIGFWKQAELAF